jgi:hypothetical protein
MEKLYRHKPEDLDFEFRRVYSNHVVKNADIVAGTNTKITYDEKGLIVSGTSTTGTGYVHITGGAEDAAAATGFLFTGRQILTAGSGLYTPTAGTTAILIEVQGGGGGAGGCATNAAGAASAAGGGGAGGYAKHWILSPAASYDYVVGAVANGGTAGANAGTAGNLSSFTIHGGAAVVSCAGGGAGLAGGTVASFPVAAAGCAAGGAVTGAVDLAIPGGGSSVNFILSSAAGGPQGGIGGKSVLGNSGQQTCNGAGIAGTGYGSGGGGAARPASGAAAAGGNGAAGLIIVWEYK